MSIYSRDLIDKDFNYFDTLPDEFEISFDDGVTILSSKRKAYYSSLFWTIHKHYPKTPLLSTHHVISVLKNKPLTSKTHTDLLTKIFKDTVTIYHLNTPESKEHLLQIIYEITNNVYSIISQLSEPDVTSIDILDFIEIIDSLEKNNITTNIKPNKNSIRDVYAKINEFIHNEPSIKNNQLVRAVKSKTVNMNQVQQCIGVRGFLTEVDGTIFETPVLSNFTKGINDLYGFMAESRSAAKSLFFSDANLQDSEYFARRLQLVSMIVEKIEYLDCGSTDYLEWLITPPLIDSEGNVLYQGDLEFMIGKHYYDEESNRLKTITHNDPLLHNKSIKIRSPLYCKLSNPHNVCQVCFGDLSHNVSRFSNLGHLCVVTMTQQTTQSVLSIKHSDDSSVGSNIRLDHLSSTFFTTNKIKDSYILKKELKDKILQIVINKDDAEGVINLSTIDNIDHLSPNRISSIKFIELVCMDRGEKINHGLIISQDNKNAVLTLEFLQYLKTYGWKTDSKSNFVFDLANWDFNLPIFKLPNIEYSYSDHSHQIAKIIESSMKNIAERLMPNSPASTLQELFNLVNTKLNVNLAALEIIIYASMITNKDDFSLSRNTEEPVLGVSEMLIRNRSLSIAYAYEGQNDVITNPMSFFKLNRQNSILDVFIMPSEVIEASYKRQHR